MKCSLIEIPKYSCEMSESAWSYFEDDISSPQGQKGNLTWEGA